MRHRTKTAGIVLAGLFFLSSAASAGAAAPETKKKRAPEVKNKMEKATFAGGCFWCMQPPYDGVKGVLSTTVGYTGGSSKDPAYEDVSAGITGHTEAIEVAFDPTQVTYAKLLDIFWKNVDPTDPRGQFCDKGSQYRTGIFFHNAEQERTSKESKQNLEKSGKLKQPIVTEIVPASVFYKAEDYHQDYYKKNPVRYKFYRYGCGRDETLKKLWGDAAGGHSQK